MNPETRAALARRDNSIPFMRTVKRGTDAPARAVGTG